MPPAPDDLPRSASGRVPQWVVDEATGRAEPPTPWRAPAAAEPAPSSRPPRARGRRVASWLVLGAVAVGWWVTSGTPGLPSDVRASLPSVPGLTRPAEPAPPPSPEVVALADEAHLSEAGRQLLYAARPALLGAQAFAGQCDGGHADATAGGAVGCYRPGDGTIVIFVPVDPRLRGFVVETTAHETLHAAWATLTRAEQSALGPLLEAEAATLPADAPVQAQIAASVGTEPGNRPTELFAYLGTQVWRDGGLAPELEATYARFVADRAALVAVHTGFVAEREATSAAITAGYEALVATESTNAQDHAQYDADADALELYRDEYRSRSAEVAALPAGQRSRMRLSWTWWDGTVLPMAPAEQTLSKAADLLARDDRDLPLRLQAVLAAEASAAAERARLDALLADAQALDAQMDPSRATG